MTPEKVLIVDGNALCYASFYSGASKLYTTDGNKTGVIYGFFSQLQYICQATSTAHLAFCWDSRKSLRRKIYPQYKAHRHKEISPDLVQSFNQFEQLRGEILPLLGFKNNFFHTGFEADDLIASLCMFPGPENNQEYVIASNDQDLYQLLTNQISMYKPSKRELYTKSNFMWEWKIDPMLWAAVKCMAGCSSDNVEGINKVGEKTACKYLFENFPGNPHKRIDTAYGRAIVERNKPLVTLPYVGTPKYALEWNDLPDYGEWIDFCERFEFESFLRSPHVWESIFAGVPPKSERRKMKGSKRAENNE